MWLEEHTTPACSAACSFLAIHSQAAARRVAGIGTGRTLAVIPAAQPVPPSLPLPTPESYSASDC